MTRNLPPRRKGFVRTRDWWVTVCDACLRASCWHYEDCCERYRSAGTKDILASELVTMNKEHFDNYSIQKLLRVQGNVRMADIVLTPESEADLRSIKEEQP